MLAAVSPSDSNKTSRRCRALHSSGSGILHRAKFSREHSSADLINDYYVLSVCVGMCDPGAGDYHENFLSGNIIGAERG